MPEEAEDDLDTQIAALQAKKAARDAVKTKEARKREEEERKVLVGATPTKKPSGEKRLDAPTSPSRTKLSTSEALGPRKSIPTNSFYGAPKPIPKPARQSLPNIPSAASRMSTGLASMRRTPSTEAPRPAPMRSSSFTSQPSSASASSSTGGPKNAIAGPSRFPSSSTSTATTVSRGGFTSAAGLPRDQPDQRGGREDYDDKLEVDDSAPRRDGDSLEILEKLQYGPGEFGKDPEGEDVWAFLEPNTKIRLAQRKLPHDDLQSFLFGRHLVSPSQLYSVIRLSRDGATYDVPVEGDWVIIAVVAERGEVRVSGSKSADAAAAEGGGEEDGSSDDEDGATGGRSTKPKAKLAPKVKANGNASAPQKKRQPKKYINLKLCALPPRSSKSGTIAGGDALLQLLLFESDHIVYTDVRDGEKPKAIHKGGSCGAYERWCSLAPGDVVGLLNPRVLRPLKGGKAAPHPLTLPLALNPTDQGGIILIGQARDLGCCSAQQRDGNRCRSWVDLRQGQVCEYHISQALSRGRAGRAEFSTAQSSYAATRTGPTRPNGAAGPAGRGILGQKKTEGLLPSSGAHAAPRGADNGGGGATYVVAGRTINTAAQAEGGMRGWGAEHIGEKLGRGRAEKRRRRAEEKEAEEVILQRLTKDGGTAGGRYLRAIESAAGSTKGGAAERTSAKRNGAADKSRVGSGAGAGGETAEEERKRTFGARVIQQIGFDPHRHGMSEKEKEERGESIKKLRMTGKGFDEKARVRRVNVRPPPVTMEKAGAGKLNYLVVESRGDPPEELGKAEDDEEGLVDLD